MRMIFALMLAIALMLPMVSAAQYWTVVPDEGSTINVVNGANYAATMKSSASTEFTGKTVSQAKQELVTTDIEDVFIVIFQGSSVIIMPGEDVDNEQILEATQRYLDDQGYDYSVEEPNMEYFFGEEKEDAKEPVADEPVDDHTDESIEEEIAEEEQVQNVSDRPTLEPPVAPEPEPDKEDGPGFFARTWRWLMSLF